MNELVAQAAGDVVKAGTEAAKKSIVEVGKEWLTNHQVGILETLSIGLTGASVITALIFAEKIKEPIKIWYQVMQSETDPAVRRKVTLDTAKEIAGPVAIVFGTYAAGTACNAVNVHNLQRKITDLTTTLGITSAALLEYQKWKEQAEKELSKEDIKKVDQAIVQEDVKKNPPTEEQYPANSMKRECDAEPWHYILHHTGKEIYSNKSPEDIKGWVNRMNYALVTGAKIGDEANINDLYRFITEDMPDIYQVPTFDDDESVTWHADDDPHGEPVRVDDDLIYLNSGRPAIELTAFFRRR